MVVQRYVATVPIDVVMSAIQELDEGSRFVVETCIRSNKARCLTAGEESSCKCKKVGSPCGNAKNCSHVNATNCVSSFALI
jgi:hypothetical protein